MSMHKGILGQADGGATAPRSGRQEELTLGDYIARKTRHDAFTAVAAEKKECCGNPLRTGPDGRGCEHCPTRKLTFEEWYIDVEINTYNKTEYECMKMAWNAAKENK